MAARHPTAPLAYALLTYASLAWAGNIVVGRAVYESVPPVSLGFWRWLTALLVLLPFVLPQMRRQRAALMREWKLVLILAVAGVAGFTVLQYLALNTTTAVNVGLINTVSPVVIPILAWLVWGERFSLRQGFGIGLSLLGVGLIVLRADPAAVLSQGLTEGDLIMILAMLLWSVYATYLNRRPDDIDAGALLGSSIVVAVLLMFPIWIWEMFWVRPMTVDAASVLAIAYIGPIATALAYLGYMRAVPAVGATRAGLFIHLVPAFAAVLGLVFLGERLFLYHLIGALGIFAGLYLTTMASRRQQSAEGRG